ncbi:MAG: hypothetical protein WBB01_19675 [Phormidesmis sp.]
MKYWEFLIQKEGDQTWLPLATQQVEILAGRYCIVAHTDRANTPLAIRLNPLVTEDLPAYQRSRKRTGQTNEAGLVVVMPYRYLEPGEWQLDCSSLNLIDGDTADSTAGHWRYSLQLRVSARTEGLPGYPGADKIAPVPIEDLADPSWLNGDLPLIQAQAEIWRQRQATNASVRPCLEKDAPYRVLLSQRAYLARHNQPMTIVGKVNGLAKAVDEGVPAESELWIRLQDPQTAQVIMEASRPLSLARLPADFRVQIQLPAEAATQVVVGEVSLRTAAVPDTPTQILTDQVFTITAGIDYLLTAIAYQDTGDFEEDPSPLAPTVPVAENAMPASTIPVAEDIILEPTVPLAENAISAEPTVPLLLDPTKKDVAPAVGVILPPQLNWPEKSAYDLAVSRPELPAFRNPTNTALPSSSDSSVDAPSMVTQPAQFIGTSILDDDLEADEITAVLDGIELDSVGLGSIDPDDVLSAPETDAVGPLAISEDSLESPVASPASNSDDQPEAADSQSRSNHSSSRKTDIDFQSLQLKNHFWQRLSTLTRESHQEAAKMVAGMKAAGVVSREEPSPLPIETVLPLDDEVVIFDDPPAATSQPPAYQPSAQSAIPLAPAEPPADEGQLTYPLARQQQPPMPAEASSEMSLPVISLPAGDLVAGEFITITVRTGPSSYRPFIKLWMVDRQSRSLVMEPQRLTNLLPDALGDLRATAKLQIPLDCLDVQIAAIAIDMATQQESGKAVVNRHVVPVDHASQLRSFNSR